MYKNDKYSINFYKGLNLMKAFNYIQARKCFEVSVEDDRYYYISLVNLIKLDIKEGKYLSARNLIVNVNMELDKNVNLRIGQFWTNSFFIK